MAASGKWYLSCQTGAAPDHESWLNILGRRAGPGVDWHRSSLSSDSTR
jgi:hypothetical protein